MPQDDKAKTIKISVAEIEDELSNGLNADPGFAERLVSALEQGNVRTKEIHEMYVQNPKLDWFERTFGKWSSMIRHLVYIIGIFIAVVGYVHTQYVEPTKAAVSEVLQAPARLDAVELIQVNRLGILNNHGERLFALEAAFLEINGDLTAMQEANLTERQRVDFLQWLVNESMDEMPQAVFVCTPNGKNTFANKAYATLLHTNKPRLLGTNWRYFIDGLSSYDAQWKPAFVEHRPSKLYVTYNLDDGSTVSGHWEVKPYRDSKTSKAIMFIGYWVGDAPVEPK